MMKKKRMIFRADGDLVAGYGHVIRSLSLAAILKNKYHCVFIIRSPDVFLKKQIAEICDELIELPGNGTYKTEAGRLAKEFIQKEDIVILDGYGYDAAYQSALKPACFKLVCIDDIHDRHFISDVVINHSEGIRRSDYSAEFYTKFYLGTQYAILRKAFFVKKRNYLPLSNNKHRVFINLGGTDQQNYTQRALQLCLGNKNIQSIDIVTGSYYKHLDELKQVISANKNFKIRLHFNLTEKQMAALMKRSAAGICSASTVSYEYSCLGGMLFIYQTVSNQKNIYSFLIKTGCAFPAATFNRQIAGMSAAAKKESYFINRSRYFSGNSPDHLRSVFKQLESERDITIRQAAPGDLLTYFRWANDPSVRQNAVNTASIALEDHTKWFKGKLKNKGAKLYVIEKANTPIGQVRLDKAENGWEVDYSIDKKFRGKGFGEIILRFAIIQFRKKHSDPVIARVKRINVASNKVFLRLNFKEDKAQKIGRETYKCYSLEG
ncbi:MAG: hypothetical protein JWO09_1006 [Bacteroidetes bacterium]|nr:hypothetical protein [Bacteroidota bacterium]